MNEDTKAALAVAIMANLPPLLTEEQARFWVKNPECLARVLKDLANVVLIYAGG